VNEASVCVLTGHPYVVVRCFGRLPAALMISSISFAGSSWPYAAPAAEQAQQSKHSHISHECWHTQ
jgi:hypothetical protein